MGNGSIKTKKENTNYEWNRHRLKCPNVNCTLNDSGENEAVHLSIWLKRRHCIRLRFGWFWCCFSSFSFFLIIFISFHNGCRTCSAYLGRCLYLHSMRWVEYTSFDVCTTAWICGLMIVLTANYKKKNAAVNLCIFNYISLVDREPQGVLGYRNYLDTSRIVFVDFLRWYKQLFDVLIEPSYQCAVICANIEDTKKKTVRSRIGDLSNYGEEKKI